MKLQASEALRTKEEGQDGPTSSVVPNGDDELSEKKTRLSRAQRLRARRLRVKELNLGLITAHLQTAALGSVTAIVEDLSLYGMALVIPSAASKIVLAGDKL
ncbi:MAG: hypothetical protein WB421_13705, partial [Terriglobales bacterium]